MKLIIAGAPACGKGTQCELIKAQYNVVHLSTGDMLREAVKNGSQKGLEAQDFMNRGDLVPDHLIAGMVKDRLAFDDCKQHGWLLDGFPRTPAQAQALAEVGIVPDAFISIDVPDAVVIDRVSGRRQDPVTGKIYHLIYNPPPAEISSRLEQRADDTVEKIQVRLGNFHGNIGPILTRYNDQLFRIDGNQDKNKIFADIKLHLDNVNRFKVLFVLGGPGAGKGTQCSHIIQNFDYVHLSAGDLLREERNSGSELADMINEKMKLGQIVPAHVTVGLLLRAMRNSGRRRFLIDGFPRNIDNMETWFSVVGNEAIVECVLVFECPESVMEERLVERGKTSGRVDDNIETIRRRFHTFIAETQPVLSYFTRCGLIRRFDGTQPPAVVFSHVSRFIKGLLCMRPFERTLAMMKPDAAMTHEAEIKDMIASNGLSIVAETRRTLSLDDVGIFYAEHKEKGFFANLSAFMTSGTVIAMILEGSNAISKWRWLMGPTSTEKARQERPDSIRAQFGSDNTCNAVHGSDSLRSAMHEIGFWFGSPGDAMINFDLSQDTLAVIKPTTSELHAEKIRQLLVAQGFEIVAENRMRLTRDDCAEWYAEHAGKPFYDHLISCMTSDCCIALHLRKFDAIRGFRFLMGPTNLELAKAKRPESIRSRFAIDGTLNAMHGSDSPVSARRELAFFFRGPGLLPCRRECSGHNDNDQGSQESTREYLRSKVDPIVAPLVERLLSERPEHVREFIMNELK